MGVQTDFPERLQPEVTVYVGDDHTPYRIHKRREVPKGLLLRFDGFSNREAIGRLRNQDVFVRSDDRPPLPEGEHYRHQLIGLQVVTEEGEELGELVDILDTGANDVYVVNRDGRKDMLLPAIDEVVLRIDLEAGEIRVHLLAGLDTM